MSILEIPKVTINKVYEDGQIQLTRYTSLQRDGVEISRVDESDGVIAPCVKINNVWNDYDYSLEPQLLQNLCAGIWTDELKTQYKADQDAGSLV